MDETLKRLNVLTFQRYLFCFLMVITSASLGGNAIATLLA